mgnify:CR=1 FL=1
MPAFPEGLRPSPVLATVDYDRDGIQHGFLRLPYSRDDSAWGSVVIPITVIRNGEGPTALLTGANHGDEYEGQLIARRLFARLEPADLPGTLIAGLFLGVAEAFVAFYWAPQWAPAISIIIVLGGLLLFPGLARTRRAA